MSELKKGDRVIYKTKAGDPELGTVTGLSSDESLVFVLYDGDTGSKATRKVDLELKDKAAGVHPAVLQSWEGGSRSGQ